MSKQVYISADYAENNGDREVVELLNKWGSDSLHKVDFIDMSKVSSGSVSKNPDCRPCDLKKEFNSQIRASSAVIIVVGDKTKSRTAGSNCSRVSADYSQCNCTPYKQNTNGTKTCKVMWVVDGDPNGDVGYINNLSYLRHEFEQAKRCSKKIIVLYNSTRCETDWLPYYLINYKSVAQPFWIKDVYGSYKGNYEFIKKELGYD